MSGQSPGGGPPPGWYPDPDGSGNKWWDGERWTEHRQPMMQSPSPQQQPGSGSGGNTVRVLAIIGVSLLVLIVGCAGLIVVAEEGGRGNCLQNNLGAEFCGQEAVDYCRRLDSDERQQRAEERRLLRDQVQDARELAAELGESEQEAEQRARRDFAPTRESAFDRKSDQVCQEIFEAEGVE